MAYGAMPEVCLEQQQDTTLASRIISLRLFGALLIQDPAGYPSRPGPRTYLLRVARNRLSKARSAVATGCRRPSADRQRVNGYEDEDNDSSKTSGADRDFETTFERRHSADLQVDLWTKRNDPGLQRAPKG